jgi:hypothetical protein
MMLQRIEVMSAEHARQLAERDQAIKHKVAKLQKVTFELARLKAWKLGAKTEAMTAERRRLFEETEAEDEAALQAQLHALQGKTTTSTPRRLRTPSASARAASRCRTPCGGSFTTTSPRTPLPRAWLQSPDVAHRRRRQRAAGHHPCGVLRAPARAWQVGLQVL